VIEGIGFDNLTMEEAVSACLSLVEKGGYVVTINPEIVWLCRKDGRLREIINHADLVVADGIGIIYASRILGTPLKERIPGIDLAETVITKLAATGKSVFLFGAKPGVAEQAAKNLTLRYPGLSISGTADGFFQDSGPVVRKIQDAAPGFLAVCLGAPKQEIWMAENLSKLPPCLMMGLGGALDGFAGIVKRAPERWRKLGLEWLYRLIRQPSRIKRMVKLPAFILTVMIHRLRGRDKRKGGGNENE
jgi:N-acetylglucosaminyldiphosphoundecaprenol N-acetyl-beta-D-mannosaminyltransferase